MEPFFSRVVSQFLELHCEIVPGKSAQGRVLFRRFREYWNEVTHGARHPALLGQFRVELTKQGFTSTGGKWPLWEGLALRKKKYIKAASKESAAKQEQLIHMTTANHAHAEIPIVCYAAK